MLRDITLGQYYPIESTIHKLDPRVKLFGTLMFLISLFITDNYIGYLLALTFLAWAIVVSKVPFSYIVKGMKAIVVLLLFSVVLNLFLTTGHRRLHPHQVDQAHLGKCVAYCCSKYGCCRDHICEGPRRQLYSISS